MLFMSEFDTLEEDLLRLWPPTTISFILLCQFDQPDKFIIEPANGLEKSPDCTRSPGHWQVERESRARTLPSGFGISRGAANAREEQVADISGLDSRKRPLESP